MSERQSVRPALSGEYSQANWIVDGENELADRIARYYMVRDRAFEGKRMASHSSRDAFAIRNIPGKFRVNIPGQGMGKRKAR